MYVSFYKFKTSIKLRPNDENTIWKVAADSIRFTFFLYVCSACQYCPLIKIADGDKLATYVHTAGWFKYLVESS